MGRIEPLKEYGKKIGLWAMVLLTVLFLPGCRADRDSAAAFFEKKIVLERKSAGAFAIPKLVVGRSGTVFIALQDRSGGDWGKPIHPLMMRSRNGGLTWSEPEPIGIPLDENGRFHVKPTGMVADRKSGRLLVFLVRSPLETAAGDELNERWFYSHLQLTWDLGRAWFLISSINDGQTWSEPIEITGQLRQKPHWQEWSPVHSGIQLKYGEYAGRLVVPVRCYCPDHDPSEIDWKNQTNSLIFSDDGGDTWTGGERTGPQVGECSIAELADGSVYVNQRIAPGSSEPGRSYVVSRDGGRSFSEKGKLTELNDVRCHAGLVDAVDPMGRHVLVLSNVPGPGRKGLAASISLDGGKTWLWKGQIEAGHSAYSDLAQLPNGDFICVYETGSERSRRDLALARFNWSWLYR